MSMKSSTNSVALFYACIFILSAIVILSWTTTTTAAAMGRKMADFGVIKKRLQDNLAADNATTCGFQLAATVHDQHPSSSTSPPDSSSNVIATSSACKNETAMEEKRLVPSGPNPLHN